MIKMNYARKNKMVKELIKKRNLIEIQKYVNGNDFATYNFTKGGYYLPLSYGCLFDKTGDINEIDYKGEEYINIEMMLKKGLFKIDDNINAISKITDKLKPFALYQYYIDRNNFHLTFWTDNKENKDLTGNVKLCYPMYYAYKIEENILYNRCKKSELVEDLNEIKEEYPYIKNDFYTYITSDVGLDFDKELLNTRKLTK